MTRIVQRLDKWLWHARFAKTRTIAQKLVSSGKVRVDRTKITSPGKRVGPGNVVTLALSQQVRIIEIIALAEQRGSYEIASKLYHDLAPPEPASPRSAPSIKPGGDIGGVGRPTKHQRKKILALKRHFVE